MSITATAIKYRVTLALAMALLLLGALAGVATAQLGHIMSRQMRADTATSICTMLQHQQYVALAAMVDPAPVPPTATGAFDGDAFQTQLQTLDRQQGAVNSCAWSSLHLDDESATYQFVLSRHNPSVSSVTTVVLQHEPDNGWRISRRSAFTSKPV
jgi:hypothetical protein